MFCTIKKATHQEFKFTDADNIKIFINLFAKQIASLLSMEINSISIGTSVVKMATPKEKIHTKQMQESSHMPKPNLLFQDFFSVYFVIGFLPYLYFYRTIPESN